MTIFGTSTNLRFPIFFLSAAILFTSALFGIEKSKLTEAELEIWRFRDELIKISVRDSITTQHRPLADASRLFVYSEKIRAYSESKLQGNTVVSLGSGPDVLSPVFHFPTAKTYIYLDALQWGESSIDAIFEFLNRTISLSGVSMAELPEASPLYFLDRNKFLDVILNDPGQLSSTAQFTFVLGGGEASFEIDYGFLGTIANSNVAKEVLESSESFWMYLQQKDFAQACLNPLKIKASWFSVSLNRRIEKTFIFFAGNYSEETYVDNLLKNIPKEEMLRGLLLEGAPLPEPESMNKFLDRLDPNGIFISDFYFDGSTGQAIDSAKGSYFGEMEERFDFTTVKERRRGLSNLEHFPNRAIHFVIRKKTPSEPDPKPKD